MLQSISDIHHATTICLEGRRQYFCITCADQTTPVINAFKSEAWLAWSAFQVIAVLLQKLQLKCG